MFSTTMEPALYYAGRPPHGDVIIAHDHSLTRTGTQSLTHALHAHVHVLTHPRRTRMALLIQAEGADFSSTMEPALYYAGVLPTEMCAEDLGSPHSRDSSSLRREGESKRPWLRM